MSAFHCPPFNVHDQKLITAARATGQPEHVARAIEIAVTSLKASLLQSKGAFWTINGKPHILLPSIVQGNFFDQYVVDLAVREISTETGKDLSIIYDGPRITTNTPVSPEVKFD